MNFISQLKADVVEWARGRKWWLRLPLLIFFLYITYRHMQDPMYRSILWPINLAFHEMGHIIFSIFGKFIYVLGGSIMQCLIPFIAMANFYRQKDYFAIALCFGWLSDNIFEVATYLGDARAQSLPLVGFGMEYPQHDWNYLLKTMNLLPQCTEIANGLRLIAVVVMFLCLVLSSYILWIMATAPKEEGNLADLTKI